MYAASSNTEKSIIEADAIIYTTEESNDQLTSTYIYTTEQIIQSSGTFSALGTSIQNESILPEVLGSLLFALCGILIISGFVYYHYRKKHNVNNKTQDTSFSVILSNSDTKSPTEVFTSVKSKTSIKILNDIDINNEITITQF